MTGRKLGQYTILEKIGQGGMGSVFKAMDTALERSVALKVLFVNPLDDAKQYERFMREARSLARLSHPHLLHVYNVGAEHDCHYFAMELLEGETFSAAIRRLKQIPVHELIPLIGQILSALQYVHEHGITHRDIKSGNLMWCNHRAVVMDFGLAKDEHSAGLTSIGVVLGTPDYMAPETAEGLSAGAPTDIYSLGVVMYESLTGRLPFSGRSAMSIIRQHMDVQPPPIETALPGIDPRMAAIVHQCLAKDPKGRYLNCAGLARALLNIQETPELSILAGVIPRAQSSVVHEKSAEMSAAATVLDTSRTVSAYSRTQKSEVSTGLSAWVWMVVGFLGVLFIAFLVLAIKHVGKKHWTGRPVVWRGADGQPKKDLRLLEIHSDEPDPSKWHIDFEERQPDNTWKPLTIYSDFRNGETLDFAPSESQKK